METVLEVFEMEAGDRKERRVERLLKASKLNPAKTFDTLDLTPFPAPMVHQIKELKRGDFVDKAENVMAFGLPGVGKTHVLEALGHELVQQGHTVFFTLAFELVQDLLAAKRDLELPRMLRKLDLFESSSSTTLATSSRVRTRWKCCSHSSRSAMNGAQ